MPKGGDGRVSRAVTLAHNSFARIGKEVEAAYRAERSEAAEKLNNALVNVIQEQQPSVETTLYVLEMLKLDLTLQMQQVNQCDGPASPALPESEDAEPIEIGAVEPTE